MEADCWVEIRDEFGKVEWSGYLSRDQIERILDIIDEKPAE